MPRIRTTLPCASDECDRVVIARGLCKMHWKRQFEKPPKKHPTVCDGCGIEYMVERPSRGKTHHCSELCRQWSQFGAWSVKIPADHISRWFGRACKFKPLQTSCTWCGTNVEPRRALTTFCKRYCHDKYGKAKRRATEVGAIGMFTWMDMTKLWLAFDKQCAYCSTPLALNDVQTEHVTPLARGGANNVSNLLPACAACNASKGAKTLGEWASSRARHGQPPVRTTWASTDQRFMHLSFVASTALAAA